MIEDDPVMRVVDRAMDAQTRLLVAYVENMRETIRQEVRREVRTEFGGEQFRVRKDTAECNLERDEAIRRDARPVAEGGLGLSLRALGRKYHIGKSRVAEVLAAGDGGKPGRKLARKI